MASAPQYASTPVMWVGYLTVANPNRDGTGTLATMGTGGTSGTRIDRIVIQSIATTQAGMVRLYLAAPAASTKLFMEVAVPAITPSATVPAFHQEISLQGGMVVPSGWTMSASIQNANATFVHAFGADF